MSRAKGIPNRYYPPEFKRELVKAVLFGKSPRIVGETYNVNPGIVHKWASQYREVGEAALESKRGVVSSAMRYGHKKDLSYVEQLEYELSKAKKGVELERRCRRQKK